MLLRSISQLLNYETWFEKKKILLLFLPCLGQALMYIYYYELLFH